MMSRSLDSRARARDLLWLVAGGIGAAVAVTLALQFGLVGAALVTLLPVVVAWLAYVSGYARRAVRQLGAEVQWPAWLLVVLLFGLFFESMLPDVAERTAQQLNESPFNIVNLVRAATVAVTGLICGSLALRHLRSAAQGMRGPISGVVIYASMAVLSAAYASAPLVSAGKAFEVAADALLGLLLVSLGSVPRMKAAWNLLWLYIGGIVVAVWIGTAINPGDAFDTANGTGLILRGWRPQVAANTLGQYAAGLCVLATARLLGRSEPRSAARTIFWFGILGLGLATMAGAQARTTAVALPIVLALCFFLHRRWRLLTTSIAVSGLLALTSAGGAALEFLRRNQSLEQITSLSGRLSYWAEAWNFFTESMLVGHGYYTSTRLDLNARYIYTGLDLSTVDNTYLEALLGVGLIGVVPLVAGLVWLGALAARTLRARHVDAGTREYAIEITCVFALTLVRSMTGSTFQRHSENLLLLVVAMGFFQCVARESLFTTTVGGRRS